MGLIMIFERDYIISPSCPSRWRAARNFLVLLVEFASLYKYMETIAV